MPKSNFNSICFTLNVRDLCVLYIYTIATVASLRFYHDFTRMGIPRVLLFLAFNALTDSGLHMLVL